LLEPSSNGVTTERKHLRQQPHRLLHRVNDCGGDALVDNFRNGTLTECKQRRTARHRLDHDQAERLRPIDREQKRLRLAQEFGLAALIDLANELDPRIPEQRRDLFAEISFVDPVDFGGNLQGNTERPGSKWRARAAFQARFGRETPHRRRADCKWVCANSPEYRDVPLRQRWRWRSVAAGHLRSTQRHLAEAEIERLEVGKVLPTMKRCHRPVGHLAKQREMKLINMEMQNVKFIREPTYPVEHQHVIGDWVADIAVEAQSGGRAAHELGSEGGSPHGR
jgi:hypothetical protein